MDDEPDSDSPATALLARRDSQYEDEPHLPTMTRLGTFRAYWLGCVVCIGGFLFGYDSGIVGGLGHSDAFCVISPNRLADYPQVVFSL